MSYIMNITKPKSVALGCKIINSKPKISQKQMEDAILTTIGIEYNPLVHNDKELLLKILDTNTYLPHNDFIIDFNYEFSKLMELKELKDEGSKGTVVGMAVLGVIGFFAFSFTIVGGIAGGVLGIILGRYAGKKIVRKAKNKTSLTEFELFTTKLECLLKWMKLEKKKCQFNINNYRLVLEKVIQSFKLAFFYENVQNKNQKKVLMHLIKKIKKELMGSRNSMTLYFSYKLFKEFRQRNPLQIKMLADILNNVFVPLFKIFSFQSDKKLFQKFTLLMKLQKLLTDPEIMSILDTHPDPEISNECQTVFLGHLNVKINITKTMLEFFGSNPFLQNLLHQEKENVEFLNNQCPEKQNMFDSKNSSDPILDNLIQTYNNSIENGQKHLKTIYSEGDSSVYSVNDEDVILEIPKHFVASNHWIGDKKLPTKKDSKMNSPSGQKQEIKKEHNSKMEISMKKQEQELKKVDTLGVELSEESKASGSFKGLENAPNKSFAMNRRGDEFLKMPSLNILSGETSKRKVSKGKNLPTQEDKNLKNAFGKQVTNFDTQDNNKKKEEGEMNLKLSKKLGSCEDINVEQNFEMLVNYVNEDVSTWDKVSKNKTLEVHRRKVPGSPCVLIKARAILENIHKQVVFDQIYIIEKRKKWDTVFGEFLQIEKINEVTDVIYFLINSPFGVMNRDFVQRRVYRYDYPAKDTLCIQFKSIDHPLVPIKKNCIRAETFISGYIISTDPNNRENTILQLVTQVDVKGSIPKSIVNYTASKAPIDWVNNLKKACLKNI